MSGLRPGQSRWSLLQCGIVNNHKLVILALSDIDLHQISTTFSRPFERPERVLRFIGTCATMRYDSHPALLKKKCPTLTMSITRKAWVTYHDTLTVKLSNPIAIVGAPGLRSVGKIAVDMLIEHLQPQLYAEIYSYGFPSIYYGPSYLGAPSHAGGVTTQDQLTELPSVKVFIIESKSGSGTADKEFVLISGYQAYDPLNQHMVVDRVTDVLKELGVKRVFSLGAQVIESGTTCCATDTNVLDEMATHGITQTHVDRFIGFSGLVAALAMMKGIEGVCLFSSTTQNNEDPEYPDLDAAQELVVRVAEILGFQIDTADFERLRGHEQAFYEEQEPEEIEQPARTRERKPYSEDLDGYV